MSETTTLAIAKLSSEVHSMLDGAQKPWETHRVWAAQDIVDYLNERNPGVRTADFRENDDRPDAYFLRIPVYAHPELQPGVYSLETNA